MSLYDQLTIIARPVHILGVRTSEAYLAAQALQVDRLTAVRTLPGVSVPYDQPDGAVAWIGGGKWLVTCVCDNAPSASPEWDLALCYECGAKYHGIVFPSNAADIEKALCVRRASFRSWTTETLDDLKAWNVANGLRESL